MSDDDHRDADLRGHSFADEDHSSADFSGADLRGADFSRAHLRSADFSGAKLGLRPLAGTALFAASLVIVGATGWLIGWTLRDLSDGLLDEGWEETFGRTLAFLVVAFFIISVIAFGLARALRYGAIALVAGLAANYLVIGVTTQQFDLARDGRVLGVLMLLAASMIAGGIARVVGGSFTTWAVVVVGLTGGFAAGRAGGGIAGVVVSVLLVVLAKRALRNDERDRLARRFVHGIVTRNGTRFTDADLTGADFAGTQLAQCDFTGATLDDVALESAVGWPAFVEGPQPPHRS